MCRNIRYIVLLFLLPLAFILACQRYDDDPVETRRATSLQITASPELSAIDSLMWRHPDSALACLLPYFDTCCRDAKFCVSTTTAFNRHYAHLLLAELLYKNDYAQTNRPALQQAVHYFDSLAFTLKDTPSPKHLIAGTDPLSLTRNDNIVFLDARAHYIHGVGYYENDSIVEACAEYLKALELMENHFEKKDLVGKKARFMTYTYNRLGDMFSEQYMMKSAMVCFENALAYCKIEPTSPYGVSNNLYRIGKQYDKMNEIDTASRYYELAIKEIPDTDNLVYRDIIASKALCDYQKGIEIEQLMKALKQTLINADDNEELITRFLTIGDVFFEEGLYDSASCYLEPVFVESEDMVSKIQAAEYLRIIYDSLKNSKKSDECIRFLAQQKKAEGQNKSLVSQLDDLFQNYLDQKQKYKAEVERKKTVKNTIGVIILIVILVTLVIIALAKLRSKNKEKIHKMEIEMKEAKSRKELEERDKRYAEAIEAERQVHQMEQAALSGRLKRSNQVVRELKDQIKRQNDFVEKTETTISFAEEPICCLILERVNKGNFKSKMNFSYYKESALNKQQLFSLRLAADRHYGQFTVRLKKTYPGLTNADLDYCCLYLLGLSDADVAALMQRAYSTVIERNVKLRKIIGYDDSLPITLMVIAKSGSSSI